MPAATIVLALVIRLYDVYGVGPHALKTAETVSTAILEKAGIEAVWVPCSADSARSVVVWPPCSEAPRPSMVLMRVAAAPRGGTNLNTLGFAYVDASTGGGALATVFADRIAAMAETSPIDSGTLLGRAMAHEIGHLLLGTTTHAPRGLMRECWTPALLQRRNPQDWLFSRDERERLASRLELRAAE